MTPAEPSAPIRVDTATATATTLGTNPTDVAAGTQPVPEPGTTVEDVVWEAGYSWRNFAIGLAFRILLTVGWLFILRRAAVENSGPLIVFAAWIVGLFALSLWVGLAYRWIRSRLVRRYRLTTRRVSVFRGILGRETEGVDLADVKDVSLAPVTRIRVMLGIGTVNVSSNGKGACHILGVGKPGEVAELIKAQAALERDRVAAIEGAKV